MAVVFSFNLFWEVCGENVKVGSRGNSKQSLKRPQSEQESVSLNLQHWTPANWGIRRISASDLEVLANLGLRIVAIYNEATRWHHSAASQDKPDLCSVAIPGPWL